MLARMANSVLSYPIRDSVYGGLDALGLSSWDSRAFPYPIDSSANLTEFPPDNAISNQTDIFISSVFRFAEACTTAVRHGWKNCFSLSIGRLRRNRGQRRGGGCAGGGGGGVFFTYRTNPLLILLLLLQLRSENHGKLYSAKKSQFFIFTHDSDTRKM